MKRGTSRPLSPLAQVNVPDQHALALLGMSLMCEPAPIDENAISPVTPNGIRWTRTPE